MSEHDYAVLQALSDPAFLARGGRVTACNVAARTLLPALKVGGGLPEGLADLDAGAVLVPAAGQYWSCSVSPCGEDALYLLRPQPAAITNAQLDGVSRRLREQMGQLMLSAQLMTREGEDDPRINAVNQALCRMIRITEHLDLLRELEEEESAPRLRTLDLAGLCMQSVREAYHLLESVGVETEYDSALTSLLVKGSAPLLEQLVLELIANAARAAGKGGRVTVSVSRHGRYALLTVSDSGGKDAGHPLGQMMTGERLSGQLPEPGEGAGLGLALVGRIVRAHGARMVMERREGVYVSVQLPLAEPGAPVGVETLRPTYCAGPSPALIALADLLPASAFSALAME
ncbi:MAG: hypothetical protein J6R39_05405 [Oscillospiraceae bacterium]|nr:hypothetical protein [Oscillospiraceae bacterium]